MRLVSLLLALVLLAIASLKGHANDSAPSASDSLIQPVADVSPANLTQAPATPTPQAVPAGYFLATPVFLGQPRYVPFTPAQPVIYERQYRTPLRNVLLGKYHWGLVPQGTLSPTVSMPPASTGQFVLLQ
jgi:hypothetical protein